MTIASHPPAAPTRWGTVPACDRITYRPRPDQGPSHQPPLGAITPAEDDDALPRVLTLLSPDEQVRFDGVLRGRCAATHLVSVGTLEAALLARAADGVVVSASVVAAGGARALAGVAGLARAFATTPLTVLVTADVTPAVLVALGRSGARAVLDVRGAPGWSALPALWPSSGVRSLAQRAAEELGGPLGAVSPAMRRFVLTMFAVPARVRTVRSYAPRFGVLPTTMMSRFFRAGLPAPRTYLAYAGLVRAAQLLESPRWTVGAVAAELEHSSAQAFSRHLHLQLRLRPREFRRSYGAAGMLERFAADLLVPHAAVLATFDPFDGAGRPVVPVPAPAPVSARPRPVLAGNGGGCS